MRTHYKADGETAAGIEDIRTESQKAVDAKLSDEADHVEALKAITHEAAVKTDAENARWAARKPADKTSKKDADKQ